jgi:omega-amidase
MTRVALVQFDLILGRPEENKRKVEQLIHQAVEKEANIIVLPEMWATGYALDKISELADYEGKDLQQFLSGLSKQYKIQIVGGSIAEKRADGVYNTSYTFSESGELINTYRKIHLFQLMDEHIYLKPGNEATVYPINGIPVSTIICYDLRFPELTRRLALEGAQILFVPAEWPHPRLSHWRTLLIARAIENQMFVISCNRVGVAGSTEFFGNSMVIDPWGNVLLECDDTEGVFTVDIDLSTVAEVRKQIPIFSDRRPALYNS